MVRKNLLILFLACLSVSAFADGGLRSLAAKLSSSTASFSYEYVSTTSSGYKVKGQGTAVICGGKFRVEGDGMEIWCDGQSRWIVDRDAMEVVIEPVASGAADYALNPALLIGAIGTDVKAGEPAAATFRGRQCSRISLTPPSGSGLSEVVLYLSGETLLGAAATGVDGTSTEFTVGSMTFSGQEQSFVFDTGSLGKDWVVTDLR